MNIYILRHGIADSPEKHQSDDARDLTPVGVKKMEKASRGIGALVSKFDRILTSPLIRARHTAEIVATALKCSDQLEIFDALRPGSAPQRVLSRLTNFGKKAEVLIVGHEPDLSYLAAALLGHSHPLFAFKRGALCLIEMNTKVSAGGGELKWLLTSKQLRAIRSKA